MFSENLKKLRKANNLTQREFAKKINVSPSAVAMWELAQREPGYDMLIKLSEFFDVDVNYLIGLSGDPTPPNKKKANSEDEPELDEDILRLQEIAKDLSIENIKFLIKQARLLRAQPDDDLL